MGMRSGRDSGSRVRADRRCDDQLAGVVIQVTQSLTRRGLVGRWLVAGTGALAAGNLARPLDAGAQDAPAEESGVVARSPSGAIALDLLGGDAWAWRKTLAGTCPGCPP